MCGCLFRGGNDFFRIGIWIKACNVIRNRFIKKLYALGQIPDVVTQYIWFVIVQRCAVQSNFAIRRAPDPCDGACQC